MHAICGKCGGELPMLGSCAFMAGHDCVKKLVGARQIMVVVTDKGYTVQEGDRYADELCWDEMLGQVAELTHPRLNNDGRYRMCTTAEWKAWRDGMGRRPE